jgi:uncharacterized DUF497 family protein
MMRFTWDENKNRANLQKHGISFETAAQVFDDPNAIMRLDASVDHEARWQTIGCVAEGLLVVLVVHTITEDDGGEVIRIISARKATARERKLYEKGETSND